MSVELTVYLARSAMPSTRDWAQAIVEAGFPAELDAEFDVDSFSGFLSSSAAHAPARSGSSGPSTLSSSSVTSASLSSTGSSSARCRSSAWVTWAIRQA
jgi:hypothetical protein